MTFKAWLRKKCYWFIDIERADHYFERLMSGQNIVIKKFSGKTKKLATCGSTDGKPKHIEINKEQLELRYATEWYGYTWTGWQPWDHWARLWYPQVRAHNDTLIDEHVRLPLQRWTENCLFLNYFNMSPRKAKFYYYLLKLWKPKLLVGYSEALYLFAKHCSDQGLVLHIPATVSSGGHLKISWMHKIRSQFCTRVFNRYGCSEVGQVAMEERPGTQRLRIMTMRGLSVKRGAGDHLLVTDINNKATEIKDYDLGDTGKVHGGKYIIDLEGHIKGPQSYLRIKRD
jgi:phenylacetate-CoA ligase